MADAKDGLLVTSMFGPSLNANTGDWSVGCSGFWFEQGQLAYPVNEITVAGKLQEMFLHMTPASDLIFKRGTDAPTVRVDGMTLAGA